jgi:hypothetical protein
LVVQHRFPLLLRKLDPETSISTPVPTASFIAVRIIHIPGISIHMPGILIHILPESLFTSPRNRYSHAPEYAVSRKLIHSSAPPTRWLRSRVHAKPASSTSRGVPSFHAFCSEFGVLRLSSKGPSHSIATAKFPEAFGCTRSTLPRAFSSMPGLGTCAIPTANSTVEPAGIRKALDSRMPLRLMFSD